MGVGDGRSGYRVLTIKRLLAFFVFLATCLLLIEDCDKPVKLGGLLLVGVLALMSLKEVPPFFCEIIGWFSVFEW